MTHDLHGIPIERFTRFGQLDAARSTLEQDDVQSLLEKVDLLNERRRRDIERAGSPAETPRVCRFDEGLDVARVHGHPFVSGLNLIRS